MPELPRPLSVTRPAYAYRLEISYPEGSGAPGWQPPRWDDYLRKLPARSRRKARRAGFRWPRERMFLSSFACKGSPSTSSMYEAALRLRRHERSGQKTTVIYLGDHDPTGIDISRDIQDRLALFRSVADVERIALNMDQVIALNPPPSPVKVTDSRTNGYIERFGTDECWELDAIEPADLDTLIQDAIQAHLDMGLRQARLDREGRERTQLTAVYENWPDVLAWMQDQGLVSADDGED